MVPMDVVVLCRDICNAPSRERRNYKQSRFQLGAHYLCLMLQGRRECLQLSAMHNTSITVPSKKYASFSHNPPFRALLWVQRFQSIPSIKCRLQGKCIFEPFFRNFFF